MVVTLLWATATNGCVRQLPSQVRGNVGLPKSLAVLASLAELYTVPVFGNLHHESINSNKVAASSCYQAFFGVRLSIGSCVLSSGWGLGCKGWWTYWRR